MDATSLFEFKLDPLTAGLHFWYFSVNRKIESRHWDPPFDTSKCQHKRSSPPLCSQSTMLPVLLPHSRRKFGSHSSSLSSLADITALQKRNSKGEMGSKMVLSQVSRVVNCFTRVSLKGFPSEYTGKKSQQRLDTV